MPSRASGAREDGSRVTLRETRTPVAAAFILFTTRQECGGVIWALTKLSGHPGQLASCLGPHYPGATPVRGLDTAWLLRWAAVPARAGGIGLGLFSTPAGVGERDSIIMNLPDGTGRGTLQWCPVARRRGTSHGKQKWHHIAPRESSKEDPRYRRP